MSKHDVINNPSHYVEGRKFEPKDVIRDWMLNFNLGNAVKYISRAGRKDDVVQDLKKAIEYLQFEIEAIEAERTKMQEPKHDEKPEAILYGMDPIMRSLVRAEAYSVKPFIVKFPEDVDTKELLKKLKEKKITLIFE